MIESGVWRVNCSLGCALKKQKAQIKICFIEMYPTLYYEMPWATYYHMMYITTASYNPP